jgi:hypothetical protein
MLGSRRVLESDHPRCVEGGGFVESFLMQNGYGRGVACIHCRVHNRPRFDAVEEAGLPPGFFMPAIQVLDGSAGVSVIYWLRARSVMIQMSGGFWVASRWRKDIVEAALGA